MRVGVTVGIVVGDGSGLATTGLPGAGAAADGVTAGGGGRLLLGAGGG